MRPPHFRIVKAAPRTWQVWLVVADGRWRIATEPTVTEALAVAVQRLAERRPTELEATA